MNQYYLNLFVRFTCKILLRSKALWVCALLTFCCVNLFQIYFQSNFIPDASPIGFTAELRNYAFPELMPYMSVYLFSVLQTIILLFFSVAFLHNGLKKGSMDVIFYRPESNVEYIWGTILGFILIFGGMGLMCLLGGGLVHLLWSESPFVIEYYFFYYFTLFLPGLLSWLGISFSVTFLTKERGISVMFLLILYFFITFYTTRFQGGIFDILGIGLPNVFSQATGHSCLKLYLLQRGCWLLLGIGLLQGSVMLFGRIPNNPLKTRMRMITCFLGGSGCLLGVIFFQAYRDANFKCQVYSETYAKFEPLSRATVLTHDITFQRNKNRMKATSAIMLQNQRKETLHEVIFYLNPALEIESMKWNDEEINVEREYQVIRVKKQIQPDDTIRVEMNYEGEIDENVCYLDVPNVRLQDMDKHIACPVGKRYAFLGSDYTLLLPEVLWYPVTEPPLNTVFRNRVSKNFTSYSLKVLGESDKVVISQGERVPGDGYTFFRNSYPLTGISICIGDYEVRSIRVDSVLYELYLLKGKFVPESASIRKPHGTLMPEFLPEMKALCEEKVGRKYPYNYFRMIESPVMFTSYYRVHKKGSEFVQPEIVFFKERGKSNYVEKNAFYFSESLRLYLESWLNYDYRDKDIFTWNRLLEHQSDELKSAFKNVNTEPNLYNIFPMFYWQVNDMHSGDYPELEMAFFLLAKYFEDTCGSQMIVNQNKMMDMVALDYLRSQSLADAVVDKTLHPEILNQIFNVKVNELLDRVVANGVTEEQLSVFISSLMQKYRFERIEYEDINQSFSDKFGVNLSAILSAWHKNAGIPVYIVEDFDVRRIGEDRVDQAPLALVRFRIFNDSDVDGVVNIQSSRVPFLPGAVTSSIYETKLVNLRFAIPAKTGKHVSLLLPDSPDYYALKLNVCGNIPDRIYTKLYSRAGDFDTLQYIREFDRACIQADTNEIIVDNEDPGFQVINSGANYRFLEKEEQGITDKYRNMTHWLVPDDRWRYFIDDNAYGKSVRSAVIRESGKGVTCAEWSVDLKREGRYEVFAYLPEYTYSQVLTKNRNPDVISLPFTYIVSSANGEEEVTIQAKQKHEWVSLGVYNYTPGHYSIKLSDKGETDYSIVADAIKWVYMEQ